MDFKPGKLLVVALFAGALSTLAVSLASAQEEHHDLDKETEELHHDAADLPDAVDQARKEHRLTESEHEHHELHHEVRKGERHLDKVSSDAKGAASGAESEHKEYETNDNVEHDQ
jgi:predicted  nucleic acid-binding Zn-ribbon protein